MKKINIEDVFTPNRNKLVIENGVIKTTITDCELDAYECTFNYAEDVEINTEGYTHLIYLIRKAEKKYKQINSKK